MLFHCQWQSISKGNRQAENCIKNCLTVLFFAVWSRFRGPTGRVWAETAPDCAGRHKHTPHKHTSEVDYKVFILRNVHPATKKTVLVDKKNIQPDMY